MDHNSENDPGQTPSSGTLVRTAAAVPAPRNIYGAGGYPGQIDYESRGSTINLLEYWRTVVKHRFLIASIVGAFLALGTLRFMLMTPVYSSAIRLQIDRSSSKVVERGSLSQTEFSSGDNEFLRTQYELLQTRSMAERVVSALKLGEDADFLKQRDVSILNRLSTFTKNAASGGPTPATKGGNEGEAINIVLVNRAVRPVPGSRLVDVVFTDAVPDRARRIAARCRPCFRRYHGTVGRRFWPSRIDVAQR